MKINSRKAILALVAGVVVALASTASAYNFSDITRVGGTITPSSISGSPAVPALLIWGNGVQDFMSVESGSDVTVTWYSTDATSCSLNKGTWTGTSGLQVLNAVTRQTIIDGYCYGAGGSVSATLTINVNNSVTANLCQPNAQIVKVGQKAVFTNGSYLGDVSWSAPEGTPSTGFGKTFETYFLTPGVKLVTATTGTAPKLISETCTVSVEGGGVYIGPIRDVPVAPSDPVYPTRPTTHETSTINTTTSTSNVGWTSTSRLSSFNRGGWFR